MVQEIMRRPSVHDEVVLLVVVVSGVASVFVNEVAAVRSELEPYELFREETGREIPVDLLIEVFLMSVLQRIQGVPLLELRLRSEPFPFEFGRFFFGVRFDVFEQAAFPYVGMQDPAALPVLRIDRTRKTEDPRQVFTSVVRFDKVAVQIGLQHFVNPVDSVGVANLVERAATAQIVHVHTASREYDERPFLKKIMGIQSFLYGVDHSQHFFRREFVSRFLIFAVDVEVHGEIVLGNDIGIFGTDVHTGPDSSEPVQVFRFRSDVACQKYALQVVHLDVSEMRKELARRIG